VRRFLAFLVRNWPLKLGALGFATVLYAGLVLSQNALVWPGSIPIEAEDPPPGVVVVDNLGEVSNITYYAPPEVARGLTRDDFRATVDLGGIDVPEGGGTVNVPVRVQAIDPRIVVRDWRPLQVPIQLDPVRSRGVPVILDHGPIPEGLEVVGVPEIQPPTVTVRGPSSAVDRVRQVVASVLVDASALNVDRDVDLVAVDERGEPVTQVELTPGEARVVIEIGELRVSRSVTVAPRIVGALPVGHRVRSVTTDPPVVTVRGRPDELADLSSLLTEQIDISGQTSDLRVSAALDLPAGVEVVGRSSVGVTVVIVAETGSRSFQVGIRLTGARSDRVYRPSVPDVLVTLRGPLATLDALDPGSLFATLDVAGLDVGRHDLQVLIEPPTGTAAGPASPELVSVFVTLPASPSPGTSTSPSPSTSGSPAATTPVSPAPAP